MNAPNRRPAIALATAAVAISGSLGTATSAGAQEAVTMHLDWLVNGYHAPFFVALENGWYEEAGLDVTVTPGQGSFDAVRSVAAGNAEFGFPDAATAGKSIAEGLPLKMVAVFLQETPMGIVTFADSGIESPEDLVGRTMSNVPQASTAKVLPAFLNMVGVDPGSVNLVNHTFATAVPSVLNRDVDAGQGYVFGEYLAIQGGAPDAEIRWMGFAEYGLEMYSNGIAVNTSFLEEQPEVVEAFVQASVRGLEWTIENPEDAIDIVSKYTETSRDTLLQQLTVALPLFESPATDEHGLGYMTEERWESTQGIMVEYGEQPATVPSDTLYSNEFLR